MSLAVNVGKFFKKSKRILLRTKGFATDVKKIKGQRVRGMDARLQSIIQNFSRGKMSLDDMKWLIQEVRVAKDQIETTEDIAKRWMDQSLKDFKLLLDATERIKELEAINQIYLNAAEFQCEKSTPIKAKYMDLDDE